LSGLLELADVTGAHILGNIMPDKRPPVSLRNEGMCCVESAVACIVVCCSHSFGPLFVIKYTLVSTLQVASPQDAFADEEVGCIAYNKGKLVIGDAIRALHRDKPVVCHFEASVGKTGSF